MSQCMIPSLSKETKALLAKLLKTPKKRLMVRFGNTNKQAEFDDCGLFAAAYCTSLAFGQNPSSFVYDQSALRKHLINCLAYEKVAIHFTIQKLVRTRPQNLRFIQKLANVPALSCRSR